MTARTLLALVAPLLATAALAQAQAPQPAASPENAGRAYRVEVVLDHELQQWLDANLGAGGEWRLHTALPVPLGCLNEPKKARLPCTRVIVERRR